MKTINSAHNSHALHTLLLILLGLLAILYSSDAQAKAIVFPAECAACHGPEPRYQLKGAKEQYLNSGHYLGFAKEGTHAWYSNGGGCQKCHTHEGFLEFTQLGKIESDYIEWPSQPGCFTCHNPHENGDFELRTTKPVTLVSGVQVDLGKGTLCANCHQARTAPENVVKPTLAMKVSSHFGPHHGPQANLFVGNGAYEFPGKVYKNSGHRIEAKDSCIDCHMALPKGRYGSTPALGGHSFFLSDRHENGNVSLLTAPCESCHAGIKQLKGTRFYNVPAGDDYDGDGTIEAAQVEVEGLIARLVNAEGNGLLQKGPQALFTATGDWNVIQDLELQRSTAEMAALFNYKFFVEDRSMGAHNLIYTVQVLMDTISILDPEFDTSTRPE